MIADIIVVFLRSIELTDFYEYIDFPATFNLIAATWPTGWCVAVEQEFEGSS